MLTAKMFSSSARGISSRGGSRSWLMSGPGETGRASGAGWEGGDLSNELNPSSMADVSTRLVLLVLLRSARRHWGT